MPYRLSNNSSVAFRSPTATDGPHVWALARASETLDLNSPYAYLLMGEHFSASSIVAEKEGELIGFVYGYLPQNQQGTLFAWQVAVSPKAVRQGLAKQMLVELIRQTAAMGVKRLQATITPSNVASFSLFRSVASQLGSELAVVDNHFSLDHFPGDGHEPESLIEIDLRNYS